jgi:glycosyltransferase involved in cell wall biosynthesis
MLEVSNNLLPLAKRFVWRIREDVRRGQSANLATPPPSFEQWWLLRGRSEYPAWGQLTEAEVKLLSEPRGTLKLGDLELQLPQALSLLLQYRPDVVKKFTVDDKLDAMAVAGWFFALGAKEHLLQQVVGNDLLRMLDKPVVTSPNSKSESVPGVTLLMRLVWQMLDPSVKSVMPLDKPESRERFLGWFFGAAVRTFDLQPFLAGRWRQWLLQDVAVPKFPSKSLPRFALISHRLSPELAAQYDLSTLEGVSALGAWSQKSQEARGTWNWLTSPKSLSLGFNSSSKSAGPIDATRFGVNLFGFAYGELGIGEDLRMAVAACESAGIPYRVVNIDAGKDLRQADSLLKQRVQRSELVAPYGINIFCMPGFDMVSRVFLRQGAEVFKGRINIGWWPWEMPVWPKAWGEAFGLVDEVWASSHFTRQGYALATEKPVNLVPLPVSVSRGRDQTRSHFGLPARKFLFLFIFDFNSHLARKNPESVIAAFKKAFPPRDQEVNLVLKVMNGKESDPKWKAFLKKCEKDDRIWLITETLDRPDVLGLVQVCDAYVSLHRSEGFGRTLAEAMLYGKPVVATGFSGNADFMHPDLTFPVAYEEVSVKAGEYPFVEQEDQAVWAEPSVIDAARQMRHARVRAKEKGFAQSVQAYANEQFSVKRIGQMMREHLERITAPSLGTST